MYDFGGQIYDPTRREWFLLSRAPGSLPRKAGFEIHEGDEPNYETCSGGG